MKTAHSLKKLVESNSHKHKTNLGNSKSHSDALPLDYLSLKSCFKEIHGIEPLHTNWTEDFKG